jgi:isorenieratene synthase
VISPLISKYVKNKLGDYKQQINKVDSSQPKVISKPKKVAIIGGGLAGVSAAIYLAERSFEVKIFEKENYLGGKIGSWPVKFEDGYLTNVEHGFHAFFRQYYNLRNLLKKIDAFKYLIPIDDYLIMTKDLGNYSFKEIKTTPIDNRENRVYIQLRILSKIQSLAVLHRCLITTKKKHLNSLIIHLLRNLPMKLIFHLK